MICLGPVFLFREIKKLFGSRVEKPTSVNCIPASTEKTMIDRMTYKRIEMYRLSWDPYEQEVTSNSTRFIIMSIMVTIMVIFKGQRVGSL
jgi:hypothetical protein